MSRLISLAVVFGVLGLGLFVVSSSRAYQPERIDTPPTAKGVVYHDENENQKFDSGEKTLSGIRISNGQDIVLTDANGRYEIPIDDDTTIFVIKPRNWRTPVNEHQLPRFYYTHKPGGSPMSRFAGVAPTGPLPKSVDFPLYPQEEPDNFKAVMFGDPQPRNQTEVDYITHDVVEELIGTDASFGVTLGDIVFDDLDVMDGINKSIAMIGIPWYNVVGNHDINRDAKEHKFSDETFERVYGPSTYSFDYGPVHFIVLDNVEWVVPQGEGRKPTYRGGLGKEQLKFIETDLSQIPEEQMVVLMMHIPIIGVHDRHGLYRLIEKRPLCISISGHTHTHEHVWITDVDGWEGPKPHHHIINVTVSGSWWSGAPDERGIPHTTMADGAPNGYSILNFDGNDYRLDYFAAGRGSDYQMEIEAPEVVPHGEPNKMFVYANIFNADQYATVTMAIDGGEPVEIPRVREVDPNFKKTVEAEAKILETNKSAWRKLPKPRTSTHLWKGAIPDNLSVGVHRVTITAKGRNGQVFEGHRILRVE
ncbi:calcineurin-like phosphoesterase C-terminal domain-containing protein [Thalassoglobus sp.]|uniref:calcineurin-like phosphoesterase C-terminal domain-containing protein n=1 Tax=Thalassoglobus sp. TaxID=2795869 RepID=UPI003AA7AE94